MQEISNKMPIIPSFSASLYFRSANAVVAVTSQSLTQPMLSLAIMLCAQKHPKHY